MSYSFTQLVSEPLESLEDWLQLKRAFEKRDSNQERLSYAQALGLWNNLVKLNQELPKKSLICSIEPSNILDIQIQLRWFSYECIYNSSLETQLHREEELLVIDVGINLIGFLIKNKKYENIEKLFENCRNTLKKIKKTCISTPTLKNELENKSLDLEFLQAEIWLFKNELFKFSECTTKLLESSLFSQPETCPWMDSVETLRKFLNIVRLCFKKKNLEIAIKLLEQLLIAIQKMDSDAINLNIKTGVLDYLSEGYLELGNLERALDYIEKRNAIQESISSQYLKTKLLLSKCPSSKETFDYVYKCFSSIIIKKSTIKTLLAFLRLIVDQLGPGPALTCIDTVLKTNNYDTFSKIEHIDEILVTKVWIYTTYKESLTGIDSCIELKAFLSQINFRAMDSTSISSMVFLIVELSDNLIQLKHFIEAVQWLEIAVHLMNEFTSNTKNLLVIYRKLALSYVELCRFEDSKEFLDKAEALAPSHALNSYLFFTLHMKCGKFIGALKYMQAFPSCTSYEFKFMLLAFLASLKTENLDFFIKTFEIFHGELSHLLENTDGTHESLGLLYKEIFKAYYNFSVLLLKKISGNSSKLKECFPLLDKLFKHHVLLYEQSSPSRKFTSPSQFSSVNEEEEVCMTFDVYKTAWNFGIEYGNACLFEESSWCFYYCYQTLWSETLGNENNRLLYKLMSLYLRLVSFMELVKGGLSETANNSIELLSYVNLGLETIALFKKEYPASITEDLLFLANICHYIDAFEIELFIRKYENDKALQKLLVLFKKPVSSALIEALSSNVILLSHCSLEIKFQLIKENLRLAACQNTSTKLNKLVGWIRCLICSAFCINTQESLKYVSFAIELVKEDLQSEYPENEIIWLMTHIWNYSIHQLQIFNTTTARQWAELAFSLLNSLPLVYKEKYQSTMIKTYSNMIESYPE